jgi:hypothetical protein
MTRVSGSSMHMSDTTKDATVLAMAATNINMVIKRNSPNNIFNEIKITDTNDVLSTILDTGSSALIMNDDKTVSLDLKGIEAVKGGFWLVSEGSGTVGDASRPVTIPYLLLTVDAAGVIVQAVALPEEVNAGKLRFGLEGVAVDGDSVVAAFQRVWSALGDTKPQLGIYNTVTSTWKFVYYPLDAPASQNGGWVGLSDIASLGNGEFFILERDNRKDPLMMLQKRSTRLTWATSRLPTERLLKRGLLTT